MFRFLFIACLLLALLQSSMAQGPDTISLAVKNLDPQGVDVNEAVIVSEQLRVELIKYKKIRLIERGQMEEILKEQGFQQSGCTTDACAVEVGQLLGVTNIAVGSVGKAGSYTVLSVRVLDVRTGENVVNKSIQTRGGIDKVLESGLTKIAEELYFGIFPQAAPVATENGKQKKNIGKVLLISGGGLALIGGGLAAYFLLGDDEAPETTSGNEPNTRIVLP